MQFNEWAWSFLLRCILIWVKFSIWKESVTNLRPKYQAQWISKIFEKTKFLHHFSTIFPFFFWLCEFLIFLICIAITLCHFPLFLVHKFFTCLPYDLTHCSRFVHSFQIGVFREKHFGSKMQLGQTKKTHRVKIIIKCIQERGLFLLA